MHAQDLQNDHNMRMIVHVLVVVSTQDFPMHAVLSGMNPLYISNFITMSVFKRQCM